ncbi:MAG: DUF3570 domain-containing protein [Myxococcales bacterium]|nr:DUF3570 domain-containing protein [Myxococcales bacterium]
MRLQVSARQALGAWLLLTAVCTPARADNRAAVSLSSYADDNELTVVSPQASLRQELDDRVSVEGSYEADIISAASVDVLTAASPRGYHEVRHGFSAGVLWKPEREISFRAKYIPSFEPDYSSQGLLLGTAYEWFERRLEQRIDVRASFDRVGRAGEPRSTWRDLELVSIGPTLSWVLDRFSVVSLAYELQAQSGFQASTYRFVPISWASGTEVSVPEQHPKWRVRHALGMGVRRALSRHWFVSGGYRFYRDSWGVQSHTGDLGAQHATDQSKVIVGLDLRAYTQGEASFYREHYSSAPGTIPTLRSRDKMLSKNWSLLAGLRGELGLGPVLFTDELRLAAHADVYDQHFETFEPLHRRRAFIFQIGATAEY